MEILVVIGITAVLFFLLLGPLINSFRLTQRAQMLVAAQDAGRRTLELLTRELGTAAYVFDNTTHPFSGQMTTAQIAAASVQYDEFTNFLDIDVPEDPSTNPAAPGTVPAHAYNAKLDFVLPRHNAAGGLIDPTTGSPLRDSNGNITGYSGDPITIQNGSSAPTGLTFPLAPSTSMVRYWVGRRDPTRPYATHGEGSLLSRNGNNTYFLYRAEFSPYITSTTNGTTTTAVNSDLFATYTNAQGQTVPEFDDPDFFRVVTDNDINWLDAQHRTYGVTGQTVSHNNRVQKWIQIAKPVISSPQTDLILLPHNRDNSVDYNAVAALPNVAGSGVVYDPVTGAAFPIVNTSVTFRFGSVSADASAASNSNYAGAGYGSNAAANNGLPFIPTVYTATEKSWAVPYHISLYQYSSTTQPLFDTEVANTSDTTYMYQAGDLVEMYANTPVYDVTTGLALPPGTPPTTYVPMVVTPDSATINFDMPALPTPANPYNRFWQTSVANVTAANGQLDLSTLPNSPLPNVPLVPNPSPPAPVAPQVANARIVPGSVRVYGPDAYPGPNNGQPALYTEVFPGNATGPQDNQFAVDYAHNAIQMYVSDLSAFASQNIKIAFDYQANLAPAAPNGPGTAISASNPAYPYQVKVDYQTRDLIDVNLGVRVYDPNNVGPADVVTVHNQVRIGNSNR